MDSNPLERERGITILAKNTAVTGTATRSTSSTRRDTPTSAARSSASCAWSTASCSSSTPSTGRCRRRGSCCAKRSRLGRTPIVVINKIDRPGADPLRVHDEVLDLFIELEADAAQLDAPVVYVSARDGTATMDMDQPLQDLTPLFETIVAKVPAPPSDATSPFQMLVSTIDHSPYLGRLAIGRIERGVGARRRQHRAAAARPEPESRTGPHHQALHVRRSGSRRSAECARR